VKEVEEEEVNKEENTEVEVEIEEEVIEHNLLLMIGNHIIRKRQKVVTRRQKVKQPMVINKKKNKAIGIKMWMKTHGTTSTIMDRDLNTTE
jgi:hypothetical protein